MYKQLNILIYKLGPMFKNIDRNGVNIIQWHAEHSIPTTKTTIENIILKRICIEQTGIPRRLSPEWVLVTYHSADNTYNWVLQIDCAYIYNRVLNLP